MTEDGERISVDVDGDDDDEEYEKKVMTIAHQELCIGCAACAKSARRNVTPTHRRIFEASGCARN